MKQPIAIIGVGVNAKMLAAELNNDRGIIVVEENKELAAREPMIITAPPPAIEALQINEPAMAKSTKHKNKKSFSKEKRLKKRKQQKFSRKQNRRS